MDEAETVAGRVWKLVAVPIGLLLLLPLALLFGIWFYAAAAVHGAWLLAGAVVRKKPSAAPLQQPHFAQTRSEVRKPSEP